MPGRHSASPAIDPPVLDQRALLQALAAGPCTGAGLAERHGLTRAAVWKRIEALRAAGLDVQASRSQGYALARPVELLDAAALRAGLADAASAEVEELEVAWQLASTNEALLARVPPERGVRILFAEQQTAGRGRRGRSWWSPLASNLYLSIDRRYRGGLARLPGLSLVAGVAVAEAIHAIGGPDVMLKWPNDLWWRQRKLGGVLVEGSGEHADAARAVVGIGVNVRMPGLTYGIDQPWVDLAEAWPQVRREPVAIALLEAVLPALARFDRDGLAPFLPRFAALDALRGQVVQIRDADGGIVLARACGVAPDGGLRVVIDGGERVLHSGEVSVRQA